ncbi:MAG: hypothetical protein C4576_17070 [Desulfobacteraceae bacterium]|nr:MAG: hypothetical protein C4576_17070 [Desulfobacteraceae bacterium]
MTSLDPTQATSLNPGATKSLIAIGLAGLTLLLYQQVQSYNFVNFDDYEYILDNPYVRHGLSMDGLLWAFTHSYSFNWHPLTWISHMVDCELFGLNPGAHHMTNLLIHAANTLLLFHVLHRMTKALWRSALVAALFSIHPLHVESVAWISERKDVLSAFFFLLTFLAYFRYGRKKTAGSYLPVLLFFALGLMSKPMIVTTPFVLLLIDFWPLKRDSEPAVKLILEKIPLLLLSAGSCMVTYLIHSSAGSISTMPLSIRIENGLVSYVSYLWKTFWPIDLFCFYPHPLAGLGYNAVGAGLFLLVITSAVLIFARRLPYLPTGWLWFLGMLVPVSGIVQAGGHSMADRYTYLPLIGIFVLLCWGFTDLLDRVPLRARWRALLAIFLMLPLPAITYKQIGYWRDSVTLFQREIELTGQKHIGYTHLGSSYDLMGKRDLAIANLTEALRIMPDYEEAHYCYANVLMGKGDFVGAEKEFSRVLSRNPKHYKAWNNLGLVLVKLGREKEALSSFISAHRIKPDPMTEKNIQRLLNALKKSEGIR